MHRAPFASKFHSSIQYTNNNKPSELRSKNIIINDGNMTCEDCKTLHKQAIDTGPEWRTLTFGDYATKDMNRCGPSVCELIPNRTFGTRVSFVSNESVDMKKVRKMQVKTLHVI